MKTKLRILLSRESCYYITLGSYIHIINVIRFLRKWNGTKEWSVS